jgi:hypothetical protein
MRPVESHYIIYYNRLGEGAKLATRYMEKSLMDALPFRKADGVQVAKREGFVKEENER